MRKFERFTSRLVVLPIDNIDTDQIIPARFLKTTTKEGLGEKLFHDWRYDADGNPRPDFVLNRPEARRAQILLAGDNFGCGSSREHAPWALIQFGFRAVISTSFADIFRQNALKNGLLPIVVPPEVHVELIRKAQQDPGFEITVDLESERIILPDGRSVSFPVDPFAKYCLLEGVDDIGYILQHEEAIRAYENRRWMKLNTLRPSS